MIENIKKAIESISKEKKENFIIEENADVKEYAKKSRKFQGRKYDSREYTLVKHNISITYVPTGIIEIYGSGGSQVDNFLKDWKSGVFSGS